MAFPLLPIVVFALGAAGTSAMLTARALQSDDLEPRLLGVPLAGAAMGAGAAAAVAAVVVGTAPVWPLLGAGVAFGGVQSTITSAQVARATDPATLLDRAGPPPRWMLQMALAPVVTARR